MNLGTSTSTHILSGWKDIANYLGKGVRTVQRYEEELRLPVRRPAGKARGAVVATKSELDAWVNASPFRTELRATATNNLRCSLPMVSVRQGIQEMRVLREHMRGLRAEMRSSMLSLQESVTALHDLTSHSSTFRPADPALGRPCSGSIEVRSADLPLPKAS